MAVRSVALATVLILVSCDLPSGAPSASASATRAIAPSASPAPSTLPRADESRAITDALMSAGVRVDRIFASKFDWLFGDAAPRTGTFEVSIDGQMTWVDVHFLERSVGKIVACSGQPMTSEAGTFTVAADGRPQALQGAGPTGGFSSGAMYFAANDRFFVMTPDLHVRDRMLGALALRVPGCRVPVTLPVLPQEQDVVDAIAHAGLQLALIGGSKFETLLGDRQPARAFIERSGAGGSGADVLFLERPVPGVRVCRSTASSGLARYEIFVGDKRISDGEGTADIRYSVSERYFVQAFGGAMHAALMRGLGTREPPC